MLGFCLFFLNQTTNFQDLQHFCVISWACIDIYTIRKTVYASDRIHAGVDSPSTAWMLFWFFTIFFASFLSHFWHIIVKFPTRCILCYSQSLFICIILTIIIIFFTYCWEFFIIFSDKIAICEIIWIDAVITD